MAWYYTKLLFRSITFEDDHGHHGKTEHGHGAKGKDEHHH